MPVTAANLFAFTSNITTASASQALKPKSSSSSTADFSDQLKGAQQTQAPSKPRQDPKVSRREVTKPSRAAKSRGKAKAQAADQVAAPPAQKKPAPEAPSPVQPPPEATDEEDNSSADGDEDAGKRNAQKADDGNTEYSPPPGLVMTPPIVSGGHPVTVPTRTPGVQFPVRGSPVRETPFQSRDTAAATPNLPATAPKPGATSAQPPQEEDVKEPKGFVVSNLDTSDEPAGGALDAPVPAAAKSAAKVVAAQAVAAAVDPVATFAGDAGSTPAVPVDPLKITASDPIDISAVLPVAAHPAAVHSNAPQPTVPADAPPQEARFAQANHANIVSDVKTALLPHGGTMQIRLDPPELGALQVSIEVRNGAVNATFQTSNDDATRLLSHSLGQLKTALEAQGVTVDKIQVQQSPKNQDARNDTSQQQPQRDDTQARQNQRDQQRREMLQRMWAKVSGQQMPVDLVA